MKKGGLIDLWIDKYFMTKFKKFNSIDILEKEEVFENLNFSHILYAFKTFLFGLSTASLVLIIEFVYNNFISKLNTTQYNNYLQRRNKLL